MYCARNLVIVFIFVLVIIAVVVETKKIGKKMEIMHLSFKATCIIARLEATIIFCEERRTLDTSEVLVEMEDYCKELVEISKEALKLKATELYETCEVMIKKVETNI